MCRRWRRLALSDALPCKLDLNGMPEVDLDVVDVVPKKIVRGLAWLADYVHWVVSRRVCDELELPVNYWPYGLKMGENVWRACTHLRRCGGKLADLSRGHGHCCFCVLSLSMGACCGIGRACALPQSSTPPSHSCASPSSHPWQAVVRDPRA